MISLVRSRAARFGAVFLTSAVTLAGLMLGSADASHLPKSTSLPCRSGAAACMGIGFTDAWFNGTTQAQPQGGRGGFPFQGGNPFAP